ncbi:MAG TPA: ThuA domain-containing protein [Candidatus Margulisiibacteriota bacterium]|nr:ThuA domain-containing protein [Candidatus Margulisiibacteriota bacterium]
MPSAPGNRASPPVTIVLLAGTVKIPDRVGHHDYLGGCSLLASLLEQTAGVRAILVRDGWPHDESVFDAARSLVVYSGGGRKLALLASPQRTATLQRLVDSGIGLVMIHQAVSYPAEFAGQAARWLGGAHVAGQSARGHWPARHSEFPSHPVTRGVGAWESRDGWLKEIQFLGDLHGITPLLWSGRAHRGASSGGTADVVSWVYERPDGGRSFCFTGLDAHSAWSAAGVRQLLVNGTLWSAGLTIPAAGAPCAVDAAGLHGYLTPRGSRRAWVGKLLRRGLRRLAAGRAARR